MNRIFSGIQPTGNLHLGNYLGAIVNFVKLQEQYSCLYCVVDMHAITVAPSVWGGPDELRRCTREVTAAFIASGIPAHAIVAPSSTRQRVEPSRAVTITLPRTSLIAPPSSSATSSFCRSSARW